MFEFGVMVLCILGGVSLVITALGYFAENYNKGKIE